MVSIKMIIILLIIVISTYIGILKSNYYIEREKEIKNILTSLKYLRNKIEFTNLYLKDIFSEISQNVYKEDVNEDLEKPNIFKIVVNSDLNIRESFIDAIKKNNKFDNEDKLILNNLGLNLGIVERSVQISEIDIAYNFLLERLKDAEEKKLKNVKLYKVLGVSIGLTISIVLI